MRHISNIMQNPSLKRTIMRRVYYSYGLSIVSQALFWQGIFLSVTGVLLARWLHVASIVDNFLSVPVREVPSFVFSSFFGAISHGELLTALTLILAFVVAASAGKHLATVLTRQSWLYR